MIVDQAIYRDGRRAVELDSLAGIHAACANGDGVAWIGLHAPRPEEFDLVAREFDLHPLAVEDAVKAHQRAKLERYGETLFCVLRPARYRDDTETVEFDEIHVFVGPRFVVAIRHGDSPDLAGARRELEAQPDLLRRGTVAILHAIMDRVVDEYEPVVAGLENDVDEIETEVFGDSADVSRRIYELIREVIQFQRATAPLGGMLDELMAIPGLDEEVHRHLRDVQDHALRIDEQVGAQRDLLHSIMSVNLTLETKNLSEVGIAQNEEVKRISAWAAILFVPSLVGTIYGMNFEHVPELDWTLGYPLAIGLMVAVGLGTYLLFKGRGWL